MKKLGALVLAALFLSFCSFGIPWLEYGVLNFGDNDLPPYQPDTLFETAFKVVWFTITIGAGLLWLVVIVQVFALLSKALKRCAA